MCSGCDDGSGVGASSAGRSSLGVAFAFGAITAWLAVAMVQVVVGIYWSFVAAGSWLLRGDRDGAVSALWSERDRNNPLKLSFALLYFFFICAFYDLGIINAVSAPAKMSDEGVREGERHLICGLAGHFAVSKFP